ncbi:MAG: hypothetical protein K6C12_15650 [Oscillospiraceae bacterium]|nr:hypothetical protein [Oscillospiraceae bacterium]
MDSEQRADAQAVTDPEVRDAHTADTKPVNTGAAAGQAAAAQPAAARTAAAQADTPADAPAAPETLQALESAKARVEELERERFLLLHGVPEEDLDYYAFRIGKLVTKEKDFGTAAKEFLRERQTKRSGAGFRTGGSLSGSGGAVFSGANETMNRLIRGR